MVPQRMRCSEPGHRVPVAIHTSRGPGRWVVRRLSRMSTVFKYCLIALSVLWLRVVHAGEQPRIFNLREIEPRAVAVAGKQVSLMVTGRPPNILTFTNLAPSSLKRRDDPDPKRFQVTYGKDLVGFARVLVSRPNPKAAVTCVSLTFETEEQATAAGKALRPRDATPSPLRRQKDGK